MDYQVLAAELQQSHYTEMTDQQAADALNAPGLSTRRRVPIAELQARAMEISVYVALRTAVAAPETPAQLRAVAQTVLDLANARFADVDLDNPSAVQMFGALQNAGIISAQQAAAIDALATVPGRSRAAELGLGVVSDADIRAARDWQVAQEAAAARLATFAVLRERLVNSSRDALTWLQSQQDSGQAAPSWDAVIARM